MGVPGEAAVESRTGLKGMNTAGVHVAGKEEDPGDARGGLGGEDQRGARAVAPAHEVGSIQLQRVHYGEDVGGHEFVRVGARVAGAASMTAAIDENGTIAACDQRGNLVCPVAAVAEAAVDKDDRRTGAVGAVPDLSAVVLDDALLVCRRRRSAVGFELYEFVIVDFHAISVDLFRRQRP